MLFFVLPNIMHVFVMPFPQKDEKVRKKGRDCRELCTLSRTFNRYAIGGSEVATSHMIHNKQEKEKKRKEKKKKKNASMLWKG
jgi:hypothetical protein